MLNQTAFEKYIEDNTCLLLYLKDGISEECPVPPLHLYIEPTNACNLKCPFCDSYGSRTPQFMDFNTFLGLIEDLKKNGWFPRITITGTGEPLLHKRIVDMVKTAKEAGLHVSLLCNATICDEDMARQLVKTKLDRIQFSIDAIEKEIYDQMRVSRKKGHSYFKAAMKNTLTYIRLNYEHGRPTYVSISSVTCHLNKEKTQEFPRYWKLFPIDNVYLQPLLTLQTHSEFPEAVAQQYQGEMKDKQICMDPWISMLIHADGNIHACSFDHFNLYPLGNAGEESIADIWNNDKIKKLRHALITGEVDYFCSIGHDCKRCNAPLTGTGLTDYINNAPRNIARMAAAFLEQRGKDEHRYKNLLEELKKWE